MPALRTSLAVVAALAWAGCDHDQDRAAKAPVTPRQVQGSLHLPRAQAGAPDAGTRAGHGGDRYLVRTGTDLAFVTGRVRPASASLALTDPGGTRVARLNVARGGAFRAVLPDLPRRGSVPFRLTATFGGARPWRTEIVASREGTGAAAGAVRVPPFDRTPPTAILLLRSGKRVVSSLAPVRRDDQAAVALSGPELTLTALIRDRDGGTGRIRASLTYEQICPKRAAGRGRIRRRALHFPPSEIARVKLAPGARAPAERRRHVRVQLERHPHCKLRGRAWADATNAAGLESFSDQIEFTLSRRAG